MDRNIIRQAVIEMGGSANGRDVATKLNIRYELAMHHLNSLHKSGEMKLDDKLKPKLWYVDAKPQRNDLRSVLYALVVKQPGITPVEIKAIMNRESSNIRTLILSLELDGSIFIDRGEGNANKLYAMADKPIVESNPFLSVDQMAANRLRMPVSEYERVSENHSQAINSPDMRPFIHSFYQAPV